MRNIAATSITIYASLLTFAVLFLVAWDNKGSSEWWLKQPIDWIVAALVLVACVYSWYSAMHLFSRKPLKGMVKISLGNLLIIHVVTVVAQAEGEAVYFLGIPAIFLAICVGLLYLAGRKQAALTRPSI